MSWNTLKQKLSRQAAVWHNSFKDLIFLMKLLGFSYMHLSNKKIHLDKKKCCCSCSSSSIFNVRLGENGKKQIFKFYFLLFFYWFLYQKLVKVNLKWVFDLIKYFFSKLMKKKLYFVFFHICSCCCCNAATMQLRLLLQQQRLWIWALVSTGYLCTKFDECS